MPRKTVSETKNNIERRYQTLVEIIPDIVYRLDIEGNFIFINSCIKMLGYEPAELIGRHFATILHPDDVEKVSRVVVLEKIKGQVTGDEGAPKLFDERRSGIRMTKGLEIRLIPKNWRPELNGKKLVIGSLISVGEVSATGVFSHHEREPDQKEKKFVGTVGIIRDITQRKRDEEERQRLEQQYLQAQRLEAIGVLAGGIAHDFKNLLTIALGYIEFAMEQSQTNETIHVYLQKALLALQRSKNLTQQLLNFSKSGVPKKKPLELGRILKNSVNMAIGESGIKTVFDIEADLWPVEADESQLVQVIDNIVINARHAMPSGGIIEVVVKNRIIKAREYPGLEKGRYIEVSIRDHGIGISEDHLPKIFDPFFSTKQDGSGLGLSTSYFIIKNHHGHIEAQSELGAGTTLIFFLPAQKVETCEEPPKKRTHASGK